MSSPTPPPDMPDVSIEELRASSASSQTSPLLYLALLLPFLSLLIPYSISPEGAPKADGIGPWGASRLETWTYILTTETRSILVRPGMYRGAEKGEGYAFVLVARSDRPKTHYTQYPLASLTSLDGVSEWAFGMGEHCRFSNRGFILDADSSSQLDGVGLQAQVNLADPAPFPGSIFHPTIMGPWSYFPSDQSHALIAGTSRVSGWVWGRDDNDGNSSLSEESTLSLTKTWGTSFPKHGLSLTLSHIESLPGAFLMLEYTKDVTSGWKIFKSPCISILSIPGRALINLSSYTLSSAQWRVNEGGGGDRTLQLTSMTKSTQLNITFPSLNQFSSISLFEGEGSKGVRSEDPRIYAHVPIHISLHQAGYSPLDIEASRGLFEVIGNGPGNLFPPTPS
ncbi:hypothetical protein BJ684DRAFT_15888 [Piptocephalis cylindrospora]|uniref:AttH domain-containing protein n=1 Tax=Piptocephalis cylindrospora TaxID=1907219 RepID=A0A4P9Y474_9FUNG|nr:hypothetical protein BJ684DRAFT_15888 [Piptocephalis cylindrospora]|eukprot:RKP13737.1 hypothetical protein BJ684DRAFT_15888 [Piptocephalis cylindrospora]